jgi:integrase
MPRGGLGAPVPTHASIGYDVERQVGFAVSPHSLRHSFGASPISHGLSVVAVSRWLGHSGPGTTRRVYAYLQPDDGQATRAALAVVLAEIDPDVHPL